MTATPLLSAALIVRDEALMLPGCLESIRDVVDEIVVVDTGSVDDSAAIAASFGATVVHHPWRDDFSDARNVSLERARGRWILYIDADERLESGSRAEVEQLLEGAQEVAFRLLLRPVLGATPYREYRLWRHDPRIRFEGVMHEKVVPAIHRVAAEDGREIGVCDLLLTHLGYEGDQTRKHRRNLPLLRRQLEIEPENLFAWHHLARVLEALGDAAGAEAALLEAVGRSRRCSPPDPLGVLAYADLVRLRRARDLSGADRLLAEARAAYPDNCVLLWMTGESRLAAGSYEAALECFEQLLAVDRATLPDAGPSYDERLLTELPQAARALCLFRLGRYDEAADAYRAAGRHAPSDPSYPVKAALAAARAAKAPAG